MKLTSNLKHVAQVVAVLAVLSAPMAAAASSTTDWGTHDALEHGGTLLVAGNSFNDFFTFTMPITGGVSSVAVSNNLPPLISITNGVVELFAGTPGGSHSSVFSYTFDGTTGSTPHVATGLLNGASYYYQMSGTVNGTVGGMYLLASALVPEPETYAMLLAGLGLMGFIVSRRKRSGDAAAA